MIRFEHPFLLWFLLAVPLWLLVVFAGLRARRRAAGKFIGEPLLGRIAYALSPSKLKWKAGMWILAWALITVALANPQVGTKLEEVKRQGIDVIVAIDVSNSMLAQDIRPSRLESAKIELQKFVSGLSGDRVGLIAFAGSAVNHCPLTTDYGAVKLLTRILDTDLVEEQGTVITEAITSAERAFGEEEGISRVLIIITDGEDQEEEAVQAATDAADKGIRIYTIGMGTPQGAPIPVIDKTGRDAGFKRDPSGTVVVSRLNEDLLQRISEAGGGQYLRGTQSARELESIWGDIEKMEKRELGAKQFSSFEDRFQYFVLPALLILLWEFALPERKRSRSLTLPFTRPLRSRKIEVAA